MVNIFINDKLIKRATGNVFGMSRIFQSMHAMLGKIKIYYDEEIVDIFLKWCKLLSDEGFDSDLLNLLLSSVHNNIIIKPEFFIDCDIETLIKLYEFSYNFGIIILFNTITYLLRINYDTIKLKDDYYIVKNNIDNINLSVIKIEYSLYNILKPRKVDMEFSKNDVYVYVHRQYDYADDDFLNDFKSMNGFWYYVVKRQPPTPKNNKNNKNEINVIQHINNKIENINLSSDTKIKIDLFRKMKNIKSITFENSDNKLMKEYCDELNRLYGNIYQKYIIKDNEIQLEKLNPSYDDIKLIEYENQDLKQWYLKK